jgi:hypothetical protein
MPKIIVTVGIDGSTKIDFEGYQGSSCLVAGDQLRTLLAAQFGVQIEQTSFEPKPELLNAESLPQSQRQEGSVER